MKKGCFIFIICFFQTIAQAQQWDSVPSSPQGASVFSLLSDSANNCLYAGGNFLNTGSMSNWCIASWNGNTWSQVGSGMHFVGLGVFTMAFFNNQLYVGGEFGSNIEIWDGSNWNIVDNGVTGGTYPPGSQPYVQGMAVFNSKLYITGSFRYINYATNPDTVNSITTWDGMQLNQVNDSTGTQIGLYHFNGSFEGHALYEFNTELFLGGNFSSVCGVNVPNYTLARLDGQNWFAGSQSAAFGPYCFTAYNGELYAAGIGAHIYKYDGTDWVPVADVKKNPVQIVNAMTVYHNDLIVAGFFDSIDNVPARNIARWNGSAWSPLGSGLTNYLNNAEVKALAVFNGDLYAGGGFDSAGGIYAPCLARWSEPLMIEELNPHSAISIYPNPAKDKINLPSSLKNKFNYSIKDITGKLIIEGIRKEGQTQIHINNLSKGFYTIIFEYEKQRFAGKFLKE